MPPAGADEFAAEMQARADISALLAARRAPEGFDHHFGHSLGVRQMPAPRLFLQAPNRNTLWFLEVQSPLNIFSKFMTDNI